MIPNINITALNTNFSIQEAQAITIPLILFVFGIFIYSWFIFKFYRFLAKRDIFKFDLRKYSESSFGALKVLLNGIFYIIEYLLILPLVTFFWFIILSGILIFLSKTNLENVLLIAMALVGSVRIAAYYNEELSKDLAKMLPFALLGIFLIDVSFFSFQTSLDTLWMLPTMWKQMAYYLVFIILLEFILRILYAIFKIFKKEAKEE